MPVETLRTVCKIISFNIMKTELVKCMASKTGRIKNFALYLFFDSLACNVANLSTFENGENAF